MFEINFSRAVLAVACAAALPVLAQTGTFSTLTYNVAGLLEPISSGSPAANTPLISCKIKPYTLVNVQEDFNYHAALYDSCDDHPYRSATSGGMGVGSGLNTLSRLPYLDWQRANWSDCNGVDCLTPKGWTHARVRLAEGVYLSLYDLHTQAQVTDADLTARRKNILQLAAAIEAESPADAVIVMGDTNTRYTRSGDNMEELLKRGFTDVWVQKIRGGVVPAKGAALTSCTNTTSADCEIVDKVLFRGNPHITLEALSYLVDSAGFVDANGAALSDHPPVNVNWRYTTASRYKLSDPSGGPHGVAFNDAGVLPFDAPIRRLALRSGDRIDRMEATLSNGAVLSHGGTGGSEASLTLGSNETLSTATLCTGTTNGHTRVFYARFATSAGRTLSGGTTTASCATYTAPSGWHIAGFHGRSAEELDRLGMVYAPTPVNAAPAASYKQIVNRQSGQCLDITNIQMAPGTKIQQWSCNGGDWQKWHYDAPTGLVRSQRDPRYCLDNSGSFADGSRLQIWTCNGNANQRFTVDEGRGMIMMRTYATQVLDAVGTVSGASVITYTDWGGANQRWLLVP